MCWSFEVSMVTGACSWLVAFYLLRRNIRWDRADALFLMAVSSMQFLDAILWWDGMAGSRESCSATNWATSVILIPMILRLQLLLRHMEAKFSALMPALVLVVSLMGVLVSWGASGSWAPSEAVYYFRNRECSQPSLVETNSPLWGGINMPISALLIYPMVALPPMIKTGRYLESLFFICVLSFTLFAFEDAWSSKFCSVACTLSLYYLFYSGPKIPSQYTSMSPVNTKTPKNNKDTKNHPHFFEYLVQVHHNFCFGTAREA